MSSLVWVEIDRKAPEHNLAELRRGSAPGTLFCAVVKSNAYGHGVEQIVGLLPSADWFGVNSLEEGLQLRALGVGKPMIVLGHVPLNRLAEAVEADLSLTVYNVETVEKLSALPKRSKVHLKVETGTGRQGIFPRELESFIGRLGSAPNVRLEGLSTHFANIEDTLNHDYAEKQLAIFTEALKTVTAASKSGEKPPIVHAACTAATILFPATHFTMLRAGIGLYGLWPSRETFLSAQAGGKPVPQLVPALSWKTRIVQIKELPEGSFVGYGCSYKTTRKTLVGVLPVGYSDGYDRALGNRAHVLVRGKRAAVIGRICMNLSMVDLTDIPGVRLEDEVVLLGGSDDERISAENMAEWAGTINYEVVTRISPLLPRIVV